MFDPSCVCVRGRTCVCADAYMYVSVCARGGEGEFSCVYMCVCECV